MKQCKTCIHKEVCEKANHIENYRIGDCERYKNEADVVEAVRCRDCKRCDHRFPAKAIGEEAIEGWYCGKNRCYMKPDDFCSYGERKEK